MTVESAIAPIVLHIIASMWILGVLASFALIGLILLDGFEAMVLPRQVTRRFRPTRFFYQVAWSIWRRLALRVPAGKGREGLLGRFGPMSLLALLATWVFSLIFGFALLQASLGTVLHSEQSTQFTTYLYMSGGTFFTLGYGDVTPLTMPGRVVAVVEAGTGFGFMAVIIGYLPVLYQAFSRREVTISLMDARAGSPPSAAQFLLRISKGDNCRAADNLLAEWERWSAELLESHLSFPVLSYYRSQHDNQSWLAALTMMLDASAFLIAAIQGREPYQARLTFAMARHAVVDLALVFRMPPETPVPDRLPSERLEQLCRQLNDAGLNLRSAPEMETKLAELRGTYEPFVEALARQFLLTLPAFVPEQPAVDNWQRSAWMPRAPGITRLAMLDASDEHFG